MKRYFVSVAIFLLAFVSIAQTSRAENVPAPLTPAEKQAFAQEKARVQQVQQQKSKPEAKKDLKTKVTDVAAQVTQVRENLSQITARVQSRIQKLQIEKIDVSGALALASKAEVSLEFAKTNEENLRIAIEDEESLEEIKIYVSVVKDALQNAYNYLDQAIELLQINGGK